jgi:phage terminase large subunit GpA-like protein
MNFAEQSFMSDLDFAREIAGKRPITIPIQRISEYIEGRRIMPTSTPFPGFWENSRTPYLVEPMDNMSPSSPIQREIDMKSTQMGFSAMIENIIAYYMDIAPTEILYCSATEPLLRKWATKRLDPLIDSCDIRHKISAQTENLQKRRSGDLVLSKEFIGGNLDMASAQSASSLRSDTKRVLLRDEINGAPSELRTGEGNWLSVSMARTNAWGIRAKIADVSTPTGFDDQAIYSEFLLGDQRKFMVPCPRCGKFQELVWGSERSQNGIKAEFVAGEFKQAYYQCDFCHEAFFNHEKSRLLSAGKWEPTAKSTSPLVVSRQISGLYRPSGMSGWSEMYRKYIDAKDDPEKMRGFVNLELGLPFKETGTRPKLDKVIELRGGYRQGTIPSGVLFLTAGIDVQRGQKRGDANPPRLELEVLGHGQKFQTWSILYRRFEGEILDPADGAWQELDDFVRNNGFQFKRADGRIFGVNLIFIDSGDGELTDVVYSFCRGWQNTFPSKGFSALKKRKDENADERVAGTFFRRFRAQQIGTDTLLYEISTNFYKTHLYNNLQIARQDVGEQRAGFCDFPVEYGENYFRMLTSEEKLSDGTFHAGGRQNEALDVRVMNLCAGDVYLGLKIEEMRDYYRTEEKWDRSALQKINHKFVLEAMSRALSPKKLDNGLRKA